MFNYSWFKIYWAYYFRTALLQNFGLSHGMDLGTSYRHSLETSSQTFIKLVLILPVPQAVLIRFYESGRGRHLSIRCTSCCAS